MAEKLSFENDMSDWLNRQPFEPFVIIVASGDRYEINDRVQVALGSGIIQIFHARSGETILRMNQLVGMQSGMIEQ